MIVIRADVAHDHDRGVTRHHDPLVKRHRVVTGDRLDRAGRSDLRAAVGMVQPVNQPRKYRRRGLLGVVGPGLELGQALNLEPVQLFLGKRRIQDDVGEQVECSLEVPCRVWSG